MHFEFKVFLVKLGLLVVLGPLIALLMVKYADLAVEAWKTNNKKKKWVVMCFIVAAIAGLSGWFR